jgi:hypothetical protein
MRLCRTAAMMAGTAVVTLGAAGTAGAAWKRLDTIRENFATPEMTRSADGALHVAYNPQGANGNDQRVSVVNISAAGIPGAPVPIISGWVAAQQPAIILRGGALEVLWHGCPVCSETDPLGGLDGVSSSDNGRSWSAPVRNDTFLTGDVAATLAGPAQTAFFAWDWGTNGLYTATAFGSGVQKQPNPDAVNENLASDPATGQVYLVINRLNNLITVQRLDSTAAFTGSASNVPALRGNVPDNPVGRVAVAGRPGGGVYLADAFGNPSARYVGIWRVGSASVAQVGDAGSFHDAIAGLAATTDGRLWVFWRGANDHVFARRSNPAVTQFGATIDAGRPGGTETFAPVGNATPSGGLDLLADATIGSTAGNALDYTRLLPALTLTEARATLTAKAGRTVTDTFTVTDAGAPVKGAIVRVGSRSAATGANGKVSLTLGGRRRSVTLTATASARGYFSARAAFRIKVVKPRR